MLADKNIFIVSRSRTSVHFGLPTNYEKLTGRSFIKKQLNNGIRYKSTIIKMIYDPDEIYCLTESDKGTCWSAYILDSEEANVNCYHFRNFADMIEMYEEKGYKFVIK
jgi:hypothetical protein